MRRRCQPTKLSSGKCGSLRPSVSRTPTCSVGWHEVSRRPRAPRKTTPQGTVSYTCDTAGRRTSLTLSGQGPVTYTYDGADRLTGIQQGAALVILAYDSAGRRLRRRDDGGQLIDAEAPDWSSSND